MEELAKSNFASDMLPKRPDWAINIYHKCGQYEKIKVFKPRLSIYGIRSLYMDNEVLNRTTGITNLGEMILSTL